MNLGLEGGASIRWGCWCGDWILEGRLPNTLGVRKKSKPRFQGSRTLSRNIRHPSLLQAGMGFLGRPLGLIKGWLATCSGASGSPHSRPALSTWVLLMATSEVPRAWLDRMPHSREGGQRFINRPLLNQHKRSSVSH